ncbi:hypothetical protein HGP14_18970 [Rhizobium sp. P32RR-XVIII]|uniref:FecR family protein n=1 Tax=Rhizobium sp. P32RR-XVIII TaxID=2726738 RepID=UPI0014576E6F|nr:hypothetical protein [Rhizobium sp. P32RR-XVIII]
MSYLRSATATLLCAALISPMPATAAEPVGQAVKIKTEVTGQSGPLVVNSAVHRDERIRTSPSGLGQFVFRDGSKLAVGWGSSVVIDKYIFDDSQTVKQLSIKAAKGTFRWISGSSKSSAYSILTPAGTIGVRGTAFDFYVGPNGTTAIVMLNGAAQLCGPGGCRQLTRRCDCVIATPRGSMTDVRPVNQAVLQSLGTERALPFLSGIQALSGMMGGGCGMTAALQRRPDTRQQQAPRIRAPEPPPPEKPRPGEKPREHVDKPHDHADRPHDPDGPKKSNDHHRDHHDKGRDKADRSEGKDGDRDRGERNRHR